MEILVNLSASHARFSSSLWSFPTSSVSLIIRTPHTSQELRRSRDLCGFSTPIAKWLDSIRLENSAIGPERFDDLLIDFATRINDADTFSIIWEQKETFEFTAIFTNLPLHHGGLLHSLDSLQLLTKDLILSPEWRD